MNSSNNEVPIVSAPGNAEAPQNILTGLSVAGTTNGASLALANAKAAESIGMILAAKSSPRDERSCLQKIEIACGRASLAAISQYELARSGTSISGPSVHLLRAIAGYWGNIKSGSVITESSAYRTKGYAYAWDMESNRVAEVPFDVPHIRYTRSGSYPLKNPDDIRYLVNSYASRSERKAMETVIPEDVVLAAVDFCNETMKADLKKFSAEKMLEAFKEYEVSKEDIEKFIQRDISALAESPGNVVRLRKILNSLKDGIAKKTDFFKNDEPKAESKADAATGSDSGSQKKAKVGKSVEDFLADHPQVISDGELDAEDVT